MTFRAHLIPLLLVLTSTVARLESEADGNLTLLPTREAARAMSWTQLEEIFKQGSIDEGIPEGFSYGYALINPKYPDAIQVAADIFWKGKRLQVQSGENCPGHDCGQVGVVLNYLGANDRVHWQEMPGIAYIGHLKDIKPSLEPLQLDDKPSIIVDYQNGGGGDEIRLVHSEERIYLGRGVDWTNPQLYAYFVLQFYDSPQRVELALGTPAYYQARERAYVAAGATSQPHPSHLIQAVPEGGRREAGQGEGALLGRVGRGSSVTFTKGNESSEEARGGKEPGREGPADFLTSRLRGRWST